jgi:hypothetical protein
MRRHATTCWCCSPNFSIPSVMTSPGLRKMGFGFFPRPTPGGVPVVMMSPGSKVIIRLTWLMRAAQLKIMVRVLPVCMRSPFTSSHIVESLRIAHFVGRHEPGTDRTKRVEAFTLVPATAALELIFAFAHVVHDAITRNMIQRVFLFDI